MDDIIHNNHSKHPLVFVEGILGFAGYQAEGLFAVPANGDNHFLLYGIAENTLLVVDRKQPFKAGKINVFQADTIIQGKKAIEAVTDPLESVSLCWAGYYGGQQI